MEWTEDRIVQLIESYRDRPILWNAYSSDYRNRYKKSDAWNEIANILDIDKSEVERKIRVLLAQYRREKLKWDKNFKLGMTTNQVISRAWIYFKYFHFLNEKIDIKPTFDSAANLNTTLEIRTDPIYVGPETMESHIIPITHSIPATSKSGLGRISHIQSLSRKRKMTPEKSETAAKVSIVDEKTDPTKIDDSFDVFGKHVANKLRTLMSDQNIFAQKLINDVLFEAEMESLSRSFKVVDSADPLHCFPPMANQ